MLFSHIKHSGKFRLTSKFGQNEILAPPKISGPVRLWIRGLISGKPCRINYHPGQLVPKAIYQRLASSPEASRPHGTT